MDFNLKQWREQQQEHESEDQQEPSAKLPRLVHLEQQQQQPQSASSSALPLFFTEPTNNLSAYPPHSTPIPTKFSRMGSYFSLGQWQELELQALIYRHMLAGAAVPPDLFHLVRKSLLNSSHPYYHPLHHYPHLQSAALMQSGGGYWGRGTMDQEPGRCRRTDGKKWRCSRDVVVGQKYCERHVHRGRNRSRKPVEIPTTTPSTNSVGGRINNAGAAGNGMLKGSTNFLAAAQALVSATMAGGCSISGSHFGFSGPSPSIDLLQLSHRSSESIVETQNNVSRNEKSSGQILRHFIDDWPRSLQESENAESSASTATMTDFSLKLSIGDRNHSDPGAGNIERERGHSNWNGSWGTNQVASMGGPLAEALRSSTSNSSPTSVLHQ